MNARLANVGTVIIGRNEGERLKRCLASLALQAGAHVYVDSGSTDGSADYARSIGVDVVDLDLSVPFSAGRARNAGFSLLTGANPGLRYVQFIDGDCELMPDWISVSMEFLDSREEYAVVSGRVKERNPGASVYNTLCDVEWAGSEGDALSCGGIFMIRTDAFSQCGGFNESMIAGEEPELCYRLRQSGWKLYYMNRPMANHDADMHRFSQWWKRTQRSGYAYAHRYSLHVGKNDRHLRKATMRTWLWSIGIPASVVALWALVGPWSALLLAAYPVQLARGYVATVKLIRDRRASFLYAAFNVLGRWAQLSGQVKFLAKTALRNSHRIIEYK